MKRIIQGLALAVVASAVQAAPGDAYPTGGAPLFVTAKDTHASMHADANSQSVNAFPTGGAPLFVTAKQTHADLHKSDAKSQSVDAFPSQTVGAGD